MKKVLVVILVVICMVGSIFGTSWYMTRKYQNELEELQAQVQQKPEIHIEESFVTVTGETIASGLNDIGLLSTAEYYFTHVETIQQGKPFLGMKFTQSYVIFKYDGKILAGVDFTKISVDKNDEKKIIIITIPEVETISKEIDQDSFEKFDEKNSVFSHITIDDFAESFADMIDSEERNAVQNGLYQRAENNAKTMIENFIRGTYSLEDYQIIVN